MLRRTDGVNSNDLSCPECGDSISPTARKMAKTQVCPKCGRQFSVAFARVFACQGCREAVLSCPRIKCPHCAHEFFIGDISDINRVLAKYYRQTGISPSR